MAVGLTTIPRRVESLGPVLKSVNDQSYAPDYKIISVPEYSSRENKPYPMKELEGIAESYGFEVNVIKEDFGPLTKLMGMVMMFPRVDGLLLITIDDDHVLHRDTVMTLVDGSNRYPGDVVAINGLRVDVLGLVPQFSSSVWLNNSPLTSWMALRDGDQVNLIMGYGGVAYPRNVLVPDTYMESLRNGTKLHNHDDLYISAWLNRLGVTKRHVGPGNIGHAPLPQSGEHALCAGNNRTRTQGTARAHLREWLSIIRGLQEKGVLERKCQMEKLEVTKDVALVMIVGIVFVLIATKVSKY